MHAGTQAGELDVDTIDVSDLGAEEICPPRKRSIAAAIDLLLP